MADIGRCVCVRRSAAQAVLRVCGVLEGRPCLRGIIDAERRRRGPLAREIAHLRVVCVDDELRTGRKRPDSLPPTLRDSLELAVAVELVAEQVAQADHPWPDARGDVRECPLVHLEETELGAVCSQQRGGDPGNEVRSGAVVRQPDSRREDSGDQRSGRRLAVRGRDHRRPEREPGRQRRHCARVDGREHLAGKGGSAASSARRERRPASLATAISSASRIRLSLEMPRSSDSRPSRAALTLSGRIPQPSAP